MEEEFIAPPIEEIKPIKRVTKLRELLPKEFFDELDISLKDFAKYVRQELRNEGHVVIAITGYPGTGKSNFAAILSALIDHNYDLEMNVCFIPDSEEIQKQYLELKMYSAYHIDEASRGLHKHKWQDKIQQKLNELYDTEREGHFLATIMIMPRFQNFAENFRNFMITYRINIPIKGIAVFYKKDEDPDAKDPWHIDENYKAKNIKWKRKVYEKELKDFIGLEQITPNYWFYCKVPQIPKEVWQVYQDLKKESRVNSKKKEEENGKVSPRKKAYDTESKQRREKVNDLLSQGYLKAMDITVLMKKAGWDVSFGTIKNDLSYIKTAAKYGDEIPKEIL
jgi:hypothetical protein